MALREFWARVKTANIHQMDKKFIRNAIKTLMENVVTNGIEIPIPLSAFRECDANGDLAGILGIQATLTLDLTTDVVLTGVAYSGALNGVSVTIQVAAAAANPTDTVLIAVTRVNNAITITVTPNDGTNNSATPVGLTTEQLVLAINGNVSAAYDSINCTITDAGSLLPLFTASGGDATALADSGEGDGTAGTFSFGQMANGGILDYRSTPSLDSTSHGSDGDNSDVITWAAANVDPIKVSLALPSHVDKDGDIVIKTRIAGGGNDSVGFSVETWFNEGDTKVTDTSTTNALATYAEVTTTIDSDDIPSGAGTITIILIPVAHATDALELTSCMLTASKD
jgi:hypothetical protein